MLHEAAIVTMVVRSGQEKLKDAVTVVDVVHGATTVNEFRTPL